MTEQTRQDKPSKLRYWQVHVKAQQQSGLKRAEYCRQHNLSYYAMSYWHNKLTKSVRKQSMLVPVPLRNVEQAFVQPQHSSLKIILPNSMSVEVGNDFSPATLTRLLTTLEGR